MAWTAQCAVTEVNDTQVVAKGTATGTGDDANVTDVTVTLATSSPSHLTVGAVITVDGNC